MRLPALMHRKTLSDEAYLALRSAILSRRFTPGDKLVVRKLSEAMGLSPTPIKEALVALTREGLVEARARRGYYVPRITMQDIDETYALREVVEGLSARLATSHANAKLLDETASLLAKMRRYAKEKDFERYGDADLAFHHALWQASDNKRLIQVAQAIAGQIRLFISTSAKVPGRLQASLKEHSALVQAIAAGDPQATEAAMRNHVREAWVALKNYLTEKELSKSFQSDAHLNPRGGPDVLHSGKNPKIAAKHGRRQSKRPLHVMLLKDLK